MTRVAVIVLNWNGLQDTLNCVESLHGQSFEDFSIILVDNASREGLGELKTIQDNNDRFILLENPVNKGFAGGVNTGIQYARDNGYEYICLLNNDAVVDKNWLKKLVHSADSIEDASIFTGLLLNEKGEKIDSSGEQYSIWGLSFPRNRGQLKNNTPDSGYTFGATGGASLYRTSLFKNIGLFDETFFAYYEDVDISFRSQLAGHKVYFVNDAVAYHKLGATSKKIPGFTIYQMFKNLPLLFWKNIPTKLIFKAGSRLFLAYWLMFANATKRGNGGSALKGVFAGIWYFWTSALWRRFSIQRNRKVSSDYIVSILYHDLPPDQTGMRKFRKIFTGRD